MPRKYLMFCLAIAEKVLCFGDNNWRFTRFGLCTFSGICKVLVFRQSSYNTIIWLFYKCRHCLFVCLGIQAFFQLIELPFYMYCLRS